MESRWIPGLDYYGACRSAGNASGDFVKLIPLEGRRLLASIGQTPGPGMSSLTVSTAVEAHFRGVTGGGSDALSAAASRLNRALCDLASDGSLTTLFCACIDPLRRVLRYLSAGHESALLYRANGWRARRLEATGTVLGLSSRTVFRQHTVGLSPGDALIAFTGGVTDIVNRAGRPWGEAGVIDALRDHGDDPARILVERILEAAEQYGDAADEPAEQTVLAVRFAGSTGSFNRDRAEVVAFAAA